MDFEDNGDNLSGLGQPPMEDILQGSQQEIKLKKPKKRSGWKIFWGIIFTLSVLANFVLVMMLIGVVMFFAAGQGDVFTEDVIQSGPRTSKIAVINISGVIGEEMAGEVYEQLRSAGKNKNIKGLIIRVNSPGGTISASDQIYNEISKYREKTGKPVVAFMQGVAASGGYYSSVACDKIIAEPTAITGSIGVIIGHFVLQELLEEKLGIQPVIFKSGTKKDWPSPFSRVTDEQRQYVEDRLIAPAFERFVGIVADGRAELTISEVKTLADGSIYGAQQALEEKLIDDIGYLDDAIELVKDLAGIDKAQVIEYERVFSFYDIMGSSGGKLLKFDRNSLYELATPQVLYLWRLY